MHQPRHSTALFLFNYSKREMYGVFEADKPGGMNLVKEAWREHGSWRNGNDDAQSPFPAQVHFRIVFHFLPLPGARPSPTTLELPFGALAHPRSLPVGREPL